QYGLVIYGLSSIHDAKINNNIGLLKTQQYYLIPDCGSPNSLVGAAETAAPPDKKASQAKNLRGFLNGASRWT
ncbi:hypothetical protein, partial [Leyella stercorea]|uniref:hypothetical protein n=1 Tax=Leyella stercorea TaxID=363265 RepID=UPI00243104CF